MKKLMQLTKASKKMNNITLPNYLPIETDDGVLIAIADGEFAGFKYRYDVVSMLEPKEGEEFATLKFTYNIHSNPPVEYNKTDFELTIGKILENIIASMPQTEETETIESSDIDKEVKNVL